MRPFAVRTVVGSTVEPLEPRRLLDALPDGAEFRVNTWTTHHQANAEVAMDAAGNLVVVWEGNNSGSWNGLNGQRYDAEGNPVGGNFVINVPTTHPDRAPRIAMEPDGDFVVVWEREHTNGEYDVYARRYNAAGEALGDGFRVHSYTAQTQRTPDVAIDADGDFVVVWEGSGSAGRDIRARRFNASGVPLGEDFIVNSSAGNYGAARIAMDAVGNFIVTWSGGLARRYNGSGTPLGNQFQLATQYIPSIAMRSDGEFVIAWQDLSGSEPQVDVFAQRYDAQAQPLGNRIAVNSVTEGQQQYPAVAIQASGDFIITWTDQLGPSEVAARRFDALGVPRDDEFRVNTYTAGSQCCSAVAVDDDGDFVVAWQSQHQDGSGDGVYAQRYELVPLVSSSNFAFQTGPQRLHFDFDENVAASLGTDDIVVENLTTGHTIPASDLAITYDPATDTATFRYTGSAGGFAGVLPDGNYRATLIAAGIATPNGNPLPADHELNFFFLNGDATRDGRVNLDDFNILAQNFGESNRDFTQADFTYDGVVNLADFNVLAQRFGTVLPTARGSIPGPANVEDREDQGDELPE